ncbi:MAG TPA: SGNH/GDSL hydrolase family protein [Chthoniobacterales bacterium]|nr:SGNH/GDSL hydrolase family protein [Chthoniobacterales bacterium]
MKSATAVSPNYLDQVADPQSRFHADYLKYRQKQISRGELVARLPHVAMIGDSLSKDAYVSSIPSTFWRARTRRGRDWFLDTDPSPDSVYSVFEQLQKITPLVATEYSGVGALVDPGNAKASFARQLIRTRNFSGQVDQVLKSRRYPDLILLWIGHNNLDWAAGISTSEREHPEKYFEQLTKTFRENYERQVRRLISRAQTENHKVSIVVYGLVNFEAFFKAREQTEALKAQNPKLYPYLEVDYQHFISMKPEYRKGMIKLALKINEELRKMVGELKRAHSLNVQLRYSDALSNVDIGRAELIHAMDAWHPSVKGHSVLAKAAFSALPPSLEFLGIERKTSASSLSELGQQSAGR